MSIFSDAIKSDADAIKELMGIQFDLAITEVFDLCGVGEYILTPGRLPYYSGIFHKLLIKKTILASSVPLHEYLGELLGLPKNFDFPSMFLHLLFF